MVAASAQSAWLVQIFEVAFSRRMCCSRVASVSTKPRRPVAVGRLSREPPRHLPHEFVARGNHSDVRAAIARRHAEALPFHRDNVRFRRRPHDAKRHPSVIASDQQRARRVRQFRERGDCSSSTPKKFGDCTTTAAASSLASRVAARSRRSAPLCV